MKPAPAHTNVTDLDRINLRLSADAFAEIDALRMARPGRISRNSWITEAIEEKIARDTARAKSARVRTVDHA